MCEELAAFGVDDEQIHTGKHEFYEAQHKKKMMKKKEKTKILQLYYILEKRLNEKI